MPKEKKKVYTLSVAYMEEMLQECNEQISISKDLICDLITDETLPNNNSLLFPVTEILFCNLTMLYFIELEMGSYPPSTNKETGEDEYLLSEESMTLLQSMTLSRYYANSSLNKISYSVSLH
tara:strand:+ start:64 stop:429 length:366 start_codon:yes stop_codon:yes gene_type:complete